MHGGIVIIGAGPAGSAAAFHLARAGFPVTLVESKAFPRVKVCGEFVSPAATPYLEAILPRDELLAAGARLVDQFFLLAGTRRKEWTLPQSAWALSRGALDELLAKAARRAGARLMQPRSVRSVAYSPDRVTNSFSDGGAVECDLVIHADGAGRHDPAGPVPLDPTVMGHKCHLELPQSVAPGLTMRACRGAYVGTIRVEHDLATCAMVVRRSLTGRFGGNTDRLLAFLWPEYNPTWRRSDWQACGVARSKYTGPGDARSLRIGNAAAAVDPVGGEGIGLALWAGTIAAQELINAAPTDQSLSGATIARAERRIAALYRRRLVTRAPACRLAAGVLSRPGLLAALWPLTWAPSLCLNPWYRMTGKPGGLKRKAPAGRGL